MIRNSSSASKDPPLFRVSTMRREWNTVQSCGRWRSNAAKTLRSESGVSALGRGTSIRGMNALYAGVAGVVDDAAGEAGLGERIAAVLGLRGGHVKSSAMA